MGGGGGGSIDTSGLMRRSSQEWPTIQNWYGKQTDQFNRFVGQDPILSRLYQGATDYFKAGPSPILSALQGQGLKYLQGGPSPIVRLMQTQSLDDLATRGRLTPALNRDVRNETLATAGAMGMGYTPGTLGTELLNREKYREAREDRARTYASGTEALTQADVASRFGIGGQVQGLTQADIAQRYAIPLSVASSATSNFSTLTNPILGYLGKLFAGNQEAATAAAGYNSQAGAANKSGTSSLIGSGIGAIGSIAGAVIL